MSTAELQEQKRLIIQEIQLVEDEWILKAIGKLLHLEESVILELDMKFELPEEEWQKIEKDDEDYRNGIGKNYTWDEVKNLVLNKNK